MRREFGTITEIEKGRKYRVSWTDDGKRKTHRISGTRRDASDYLAKIQARVTGVESDITYREYWSVCVSQSMSQLAPKTVSEYNRLWTKFLEPRIGNHAVSKTTYRNAQMVIDEIESPLTQKKCRTLWHKICNMAVYQDSILASNPLKMVKTKQIQRRDKPIYSVDELLETLDAVAGYKYEPLVLLSLSMGLRPEECFALDWDDLSFDDSYCYASINKTVVVVDGKALEQSRTKNQRSTRIAVCSGFFRDAIHNLSDGKSGPLCPSGNGRTSPATISHNWKAWCKTHNVKHVTFENMRTNYKTICAENMIPAELVRVQMGHAAVGVAESNYLSTSTRITRIVADLYEQSFNNARKVRTI